MSSSHHHFLLRQLPILKLFLKKQRRWGAIVKLLEPLLNRSPHLRQHLHVYTHLQVEQILFHEGSTCTFAKGVECSSSRQLSSSSSSSDKSTSCFQILAKQRVILCAGAILSPALLLVSGIGKEEGLRNEGIRPIMCPNENHHGVGKNLGDHVVLERAYLTSPTFWVRRMSVNSMRGWLALQIQRTICNSANSVDNGNNNDYDDDDESKIDLNSKTYFKLVDGTSSQYILPQVLAASIFMREYNHDIGPQKTTTQQIFSRTLHFLFYCVKWILHVILNFPPLIWFLSKCTTQVLVCIMNPESRRSVTIQHKGKQARRKREKPPQQQQQWQQEEMILNVNRLSDFDIIVDPAYLDNRRDYDRIRMSWDTLDQFIIPQ